MKKNYLVLLMMLALGNSAFSQQDKLITHFMFDKMSLNPGEAGIDEGICGVLMYRNQWDKVNGAPNSVLFNVEANLSRFIPVNLGVSFYHDEIGFNRQNNVLLNASYPLEIGSIGTLGIGIGVGLMNFSMSPNWVPPSTIIDPTLPVGYVSNNLDLNFGLYLKGENDFYAGLSSTHLSESLFSSEGLNVTTFNSRRHYYAMGGKTFRGIGPGDLETNVLIRTDLLKMSADINARYLWNNIAYGGLTYRTSDAIAIMLGYIPVDNLTIGYSYDITINRLAGVSRGTHEIMVKYCYLLPAVPIQKSKHPRWL